MEILLLNPDTLSGASYELRIADGPDIEARAKTRHQKSTIHTCAALHVWTPAVEDCTTRIDKTAETRY